MTVPPEALRVRRHEAEVLGRVGQALHDVDLPRVQVRLPGSLAEAAVQAWERDDEAETAGETRVEATARSRAGTLALIGLEITERGRWENDSVVVDLSADLIGRAVDAGDELPWAPPPSRD